MEPVVEDTEPDIEVAQEAAAWPSQVPAAMGVAEADSAPAPPARSVAEEAAEPPQERSEPGRSASEPGQHPSMARRAVCRISGRRPPLQRSHTIDNMACLPSQPAIGEIVAGIE